MKRPPAYFHPAYRLVREVIDTQEATRLIAHGWTTLEVIEVKRWAKEYHSQTTSYVMGLPKNALRVVRSISAAAA